MHIHGSEKDITPKLVLRKAEKKRYLAASFLQPDCTHFATVDQHNMVQIFYVKTKEEVRLFFSLLNTKIDFFTSYILQ